MPKWYFVVVRHFAGPHQRRQVCLRIKKQVEQAGLSYILPLVKYEPGRQHEYYLGLAFDSHASASGIDGEMAARRVLIEIGLPQGSVQQGPVIEADQVTHLLRGNLECESFTVPISYEACQAGELPSPEELFAELDRDEFLKSKPDLEQTEKFRSLLYWCSAVGSGELGRIGSICQLLGISQEWGGAWSVVRRLALLGHLEFNGGKTLRWGMVPPTLLTTADGKNKVLVGQRTPAIIEAVGQTFDMKEEPQYSGPPRVLIQCADESDLILAGRHVQVVGSTALQLSELLPDLEEWSRRLPRWEEVDLGRFLLEQYDPYADKFRGIASIASKPACGMYRFSIDSDRRPYVVIACYDEQSDAWISGDYYGLRFWVRSRCGLCRAVYRSKKQELFISEPDRWPMPYERSLVLAHGLLPRKVRPKSGSSSLVYRGITRELAKRLCKLLGVKMEMADA